MFVDLSNLVDAEMATKVTWHLQTPHLLYFKHVATQRPWWQDSCDQRWSHQHKSGWFQVRHVLRMTGSQTDHSGSIAIQILGRHDHTTDSFTSLHRRQLTYSTSLLQRVPIIVAGINRYNTYIHINIYTQQQHIAAYGLEHTCVFHGFDWHTLKINGVHSDLLSEKLCSQPDPGTVLCHSFSMCLLEPVANTENACSVQRYLFLFWQKMQMDS